MKPTSTVKPGIILFWLMVGLPSVFAQSVNFFSGSDLQFERIDTRNGLSHSSINWIHQDKAGFIWIATPDGLNRYDGYSFQTFRYDPTDSTSIRGNWSGSIYERNNGELWISMGVGGFSRFNPKTEVFTHFAHDSLNTHSLPNDVVLTIHEDKNNTLWVGTAGGLAVFNDSLHVFTRPRPPFPVGEKVHSLIEDSSGKLWIATEQDVFNYDIAAGKLRKQTFAVLPTSKDSQRILSGLLPGKKALWVSYDGEGMLYQPFHQNEKTRFIPLQGPDSYLSATQLMYEDNTGRLWFGTSRGAITAIDPEDNKITQFDVSPDGLSHHNVRFIIQDAREDIWIGTANGLNRMTPGDRALNRFRQYMHNPHDWLSIGYNDLNVAFEDKGNVLWFGTLGGGLSRFVPQKQQFGHLRHMITPETFAAAKNVRDILVTHDSTAEGEVLWLATDGAGLMKIKKDKFSQKLIQVFSAGSDSSDSLAHNIVQVLMQDSQKRVWIGSRGGLNYYSPQTGTLKRLHINSQADPQNLLSSVYSLLEDRNGNIWIGTQRSGLTRYSPDNGNLEIYTAQNSGLQSNAIWSLLEDNEGNIWIGTAVGGLSRYSPSTDKINTFLPKLNSRFSLNNRTINTIHQDKKGNIWLGTFSGGLNMFIPEEQGFINYTVRDGLPNNTIQGILEDNSGSLWLTSNLGLTKISPGEFIENYTVMDGLQENEFNRGSFFKTEDGEFIIGGINGINRFNPDSIHLSASNAPVHITGLQRYTGQSISQRSVQLESTLEFDHSESIFTLDFALLEFNETQPKQYAYLLDGFNENWIYSGTRRSATFTNLNPGKYLFRVKGKNRDGSWSKNEAKLIIIIHPPFWKTWWFRTIIAALVLIALILSYRLRIRSLKRQQRILSFEVERQTAELRQQKKELEKINLQKNEFVGIAAHDLRNPLTGIIGYLEFIIQQLRDGTFDPQKGLESMQFLMKTARRMSALITEMLNVAAIESGTMKLNLEEGDLRNLLKRMSKFYSHLAVQKDIALRMISTSDIPGFMFDKDRITEVMENLLSNAVKYTHSGGEVVVSYYLDVEAVTICVKDTGQGLSDEDRQNVFQSFKKLSARPTGGETSSGLGLSIVKKLVELHSGRIWVESKKGEGAAFYVELPLTQPENTRKEHQKQGIEPAVS